MIDANERILELMAKRNWSAYRLVRESNLSHSVIYNMVRRNNLPSISTLVQVSDALGISLQQFFTEDDDPAALSDERAELLAVYHDVPVENRKAVLRLMELMAAGNKQNTSNTASEAFAGKMSAEGTQDPQGSDSKTAQDSTEKTPDEESQEISCESNQDPMAETTEQDY